ncbi:hypothetical protein J2Y41_004607 [Arthrobacter sp. 1088]|uniref:DEAD/DEAH box helicase n=1 Tax=Arthrobacter sp. 1088 TaxID=2817768 RepID=UPI0028582345|nr:AAA domain-containing protein [Arthrobacter sp. 1088]MDR6689007.1 hypothetical protein [Arthrobacter sp. 1088]
MADYSPESLLPWENSDWPPSRSGKTWRHTVFLGVYDLESAWAVLGAETTENYAGGTAGQGSAVVVTVSEGGLLNPDTAALSQCVWAVGRFRTRKQLDDIKTSFAADEARWTQRFGDLVVTRGIKIGDESPSGFPTHPLNYADFQSILDLTLGETGVRGLLTYRGGGLATVRIESRQIREKPEGEESEAGFFNSAFFSDLISISRKPTRGGAVRQYLGPDTTNSRCDVREDLDGVYESVAPDMLPDGRWPSDVEHPLALSQQFAVNRILADLEGSNGLFAVNGPPGTGKTTMLRDMIAALVTKRATALASFARPSDAFVATKQMGSKSGYRHSVHLLHERLRGFEMVIASSNNGAVENISLEIPVLSKDVIAPAFGEGARYYPEIATRLLNDRKGGGKEEKPEKRAWGLISAKLGNSANVASFIGAALFNGKEADDAPGLLKLLNQQPSDTIPSWQEARQSFLAAKAEVDRLRAERQRLHEAFRALPRLRLKTEELARVHDAHNARLADQMQLVAGQEKALAELVQAEVRYRSDLNDHLAARPGVLEQIFSFGRVMTSWRERQVSLAARVESAGAEIEGLRSLIQRYKETTSSLRERRNDSAARLQHGNQQRRALESELEAYPHSRPSSDWFAPESAEREYASPWLDNVFNEARSRLFLEALQLHQAFVLDQRDKMRSNLNAVCDVLKKSIAADTDPGTVREAWESLFMVVPTVTTTFASIPRLFASLGDERLGWLFIDEAGQATPQAALCGIWRARRAVLVGDPLQLTPVVTLPAEYQNRLLEITGTDPRWLPAANPAQVLADRTSRYGTHIQPPGQGRVWVGAPLRVHRRCDNPMFDAVNHEVYDGLMIHGGKTLTRRFPEGDSLPEAPRSTWLDVVTTEWNGHASAKELTRFDELLAALREAGYDMDKVLAIAPFRQTADQIERRAKRHLPNAKAQSGTIHRAQGKEANIVVLVLGGKTIGARKWAVDTPNLFNVAVSRAKHRLYIIGDRSQWARLPYFTAMAPRLDVRGSDVLLREMFVPVRSPEPETLSRGPVLNPSLSEPVGSPNDATGSEKGLAEKQLPPIYDDDGTPVSRAEYWGQKELGAELGMSAPRVGDLLRTTGLLLPGPDKEPSPESLRQGLALWVTVSSAHGPRRYARWHRDRTVEILEVAVDQQQHEGL